MDGKQILTGIAALTAATVIAGEPAKEVKSFNLFGGISEATRTYYNRPDNLPDLTISTLSARIGLNLNINDHLTAGTSSTLDLSTTPTIEQTLKDGYQLSLDRVFMKGTFGNLVLTAGEFDNQFSGFYDKTIPLVGESIIHSKLELEK
jgi:hypothetical protein